MSRQRIATRGKERTALLVISLTTALKTKGKVEALRRGLAVAKSFEEIWQNYAGRDHAKSR